MYSACPIASQQRAGPQSPPRPTQPQPIYEPATRHESGQRILSPLLKQAHPPETAYPPQMWRPRSRPEPEGPRLPAARQLRWGMEACQSLLQWSRRRSRSRERPRCRVRRDIFRHETQRRQSLAGMQSPGWMGRGAHSERCCHRDVMNAGVECRRFGSNWRRISTSRRSLPIPTCVSQAQRAPRGPR